MKIYLFMLIFLLLACSRNKQETDIDSIFSVRDSLLHYVFHTHHIGIENGRQIYWHEVRADVSYASNKPLLSFRGKIYQEGEVIYLKREKDTCYRVYLDFGMKEMEKKSISYVTTIPNFDRRLGEDNYVYSNEYSVLYLQNKFPQPILNDTIYKFRIFEVAEIKDCDVHRIFSDLVILISKKSGVQCVYNGFYHSRDSISLQKETIGFCAGNPFINNSEMYIWEKY